MLIDIYTHIFPGDFFQQMAKAAPRLENIGKRMQAVTMIHDLDTRFRLMDEFGDYVMGTVADAGLEAKWEGFVEGARG